MSAASSDFVIRRLTMNDKKDVEYFVRLFLIEEPVSKHIQLTESEVNTFTKQYTEGFLPQGVSLGVFDRKSGKMCGCCINTLVDRKKTFSYLFKENELTSNLQKVFRFDEAIGSAVATVTKSINKFIDSEAVMILPEYQSRGLMPKLRAGCEEIAIKHNCDAVVGVASSRYSQKVVRRGGYVLKKEILYKNYRDPVTGDAVVAGIPPPHTGASVYVKNMKPEKSKL